MPDEIARIVKRKRVTLPGGVTVDIPVITEISFLDRVSQAQESRSFLNNSASAHRTIRVAWIKGNGQGSIENASGDPPSDVLPVERIDVLRTLDTVSQSQEIDIYPDSKTVNQPPDAPPYFKSHQKTHVVRYLNTPDDGNWIDSELIDEWRFSDQVSQAQESFFFLTNPPDGSVAGLTVGQDSSGKTTVQVDRSLDDIADTANGIDPPWRTDMFQNIVDFNGQPFPTYGVLPTASGSEDQSSSHFTNTPPTYNPPYVINSSGGTLGPAGLNTQSWLTNAAVVNGGTTSLGGSPARSVTLPNLNNTTSLSEFAYGGLIGASDDLIEGHQATIKPTSLKLTYSAGTQLFFDHVAMWADKAHTIPFTDQTTVSYQLYAWPITDGPNYFYTAGDLFVPAQFRCDGLIAAPLNVVVQPPDPAISGGMSIISGSYDFSAATFQIGATICDCVGSAQLGNASLSPFNPTVIAIFMSPDEQTHLTVGS
jgi:hypothetical protein